MQSPKSNEQKMELTLVVADDCSLCEHARKVLESLSQDCRIRVKEVKLESEEGQLLGQLHPLLFPPILLRGDGVLSYGRLSERRLRKELGRG